MATKESSSRPAKDLYVSELFRGRRAHAEATGRPWFILSAKHSLVEPDAVLEPYNVRITDLDASQRQEWAQEVVAGLERRFGSLAGQTFEIHAGDEYVTAILPIDPFKASDWDNS